MYRNRESWKLGRQIGKQDQARSSQEYGSKVEPRDRCDCHCETENRASARCDSLWQIGAKDWKHNGFAAGESSRVDGLGEEGLID